MILLTDTETDTVTDLTDRLVDVTIAATARNLVNANATNKAAARLSGKPHVYIIDGVEIDVERLFSGC